MTLLRFAFWPISCYVSIGILRLSHLKKQRFCYSFHNPSVVRTLFLNRLDLWYCSSGSDTVDVVWGLFHRRVSHGQDCYGFLSFFDWKRKAVTLESTDLERGKLACYGLSPGSLMGTVCFIIIST